jgi:hypothetical protein
MKVAVIGSRSFDNYNKVVETLSKIKITEIVSGGAKGADSLGERYANENNIPTKIFLPDWEKYGKTAGFKRNTEIIENAELVVAFWDMESKGTKDSISKAEKLNKKVLIINVNNLLETK